jgi:soluble lytic murein transglycosylase-like protein
MRRFTAPIAVAAALLAAPSAHAAVAHTVTPGETLWSIAAASNLTTHSLAVYNHLSDDAQVVLGSTIMVPAVSEAASALSAAPAPAAATSTTSAPQPLGGYTVRWGDTLTGLAAGAGVSSATLAAANGLDPDGILLAGTIIRLPTGAPAPVRASEPAPSAVVPAADPQPTDTRLDSGTVASIASQNGVSGSLATAIAYQESGFNNSMVSGANARGVMQVMPGTWSWIQDNLAGHTLDPASAADNVAAGSLYVKHLLAATGGNEEQAIAGYYQGLSSVQTQGMLPETRKYVANVEALKGRFGG